MNRREFLKHLLGGIFGALLTWAGAVRGKERDPDLEEAKREWEGVVEVWDPLFDINELERLIRQCRWDENVEWVVVASLPDARAIAAVLEGEDGLAD